MPNSPWYMTLAAKRSSALTSTRQQTHAETRMAMPKSPRSRLPRPAGQGNLLRRCRQADPVQKGLRQGHQTVRRAGNPVGVAYFDQEGKPTRNKDGYAKIAGPMPTAVSWMRRPISTGRRNQRGQERLRQAGADLDQRGHRSEQHTPTRQTSRRDPKRATPKSPDSSTPAAIGRGSLFRRGGQPHAIQRGRRQSHQKLRRDGAVSCRRSSFRQGREADTRKARIRPRRV